jgi:signal transduction histidine kinase
MENACKFSNEKSVDVLLRIEGIWIIIEFVDRGIGIDPADLENIFHPFFRANNARNIKGNGLGLSLTERIIKLHGGKISVESQLNKGTMVSIAIPFIS